MLFTINAGTHRYAYIEKYSIHTLTIRATKDAAVAGAVGTAVVAVAVDKQLELCTIYSGRAAGP